MEIRPPQLPILLTALETSSGNATSSGWGLKFYKDSWLCGTVGPDINGVIIWKFYFFSRVYQVGLWHTAGPGGEAAAADLAHRWLGSNYEGYRQLGNKMVEKYNAESAGVAGGGGEYNVQTGFGWTNGLALSLLERFGWSPQAALPPGPATAGA